MDSLARTVAMNNAYEFQVEESVLEVVGYIPLNVHQAEAQVKDVPEESWGQHRETESEIEAREAEELRIAEEEHVAQMLIDNQVIAALAKEEKES